jgi:tRNA-specific 2-thiouridylase
MNWIAGKPPETAFLAEVKVRYTARPVACRVTPSDKNQVEVALEEPLPDVTPGQGAVFYEGDRVIGAGIIA